MNEILQRLKAQTPKFFRNIINISLSISALSGLIIGSGLVIQDSIFGLVAQSGIIAGIVASFVAKLTTIYGVSEEITPKIQGIIDPDLKPNPNTK